jgi:hypothetical protein
VPRPDAEVALADVRWGLGARGGSGGARAHDAGVFGRAPCDIALDVELAERSQNVPSEGVLPKIVTELSDPLGREPGRPCQHVLPGGQLAWQEYVAVFHPSRFPDARCQGRAVVGSGFGVSTPVVAWGPATISTYGVNLQTDQGDL